MTDIKPKTEIKQFAVKEETAAKAWLGSNWVPVSVGLVIGILATMLVYHL